MLLSVALVLGSLLWIGAEGLKLASGGYDALNATLAALGCGLVCAGIWALRTDVGLNRTGRVGVVMASFGAGSFAVVALLALNAGVRTDAEIAITPFFLMAAFFQLAGLVALGLYLRGAAPYPGWLGALFLGLGAVWLASGLIPPPPPLASLVVIAIAASFGVLGLFALGRHRSG